MIYETEYIYRVYHKSICKHYGEKFFKSIEGAEKYFNDMIAELKKDDWTLSDKDVAYNTDDDKNFKEIDSHYVKCVTYVHWDICAEDDEEPYYNDYIIIEKVEVEE